MPAYVYILTNRPHGAIYIGCTTNLRQRIDQHRAGAVTAHMRRYNIHHLVHVEAHDTLENALLREKRLKRWRRAWKEALIAERNPLWRDLCDQIPL